MPRQGRRRRSSQRSSDSHEESEDAPAWFRRFAEETSRRLDDFESRLNERQDDRAEHQDASRDRTARLRSRSPSPKRARASRTSARNQLRYETPRCERQAAQIEDARGRLEKAEEALLENDTARAATLIKEGRSVLEQSLSDLKIIESIGMDMRY